MLEKILSFTGAVAAVPIGMSMSQMHNSQRS